MDIFGYFWIFPDIFLIWTFFYFLLSIQPQPTILCNIMLVVLLRQFSIKVYLHYQGIARLRDSAKKCSATKCKQIKQLAAKFGKKLSNNCNIIFRDFNNQRCETIRRRWNPSKSETSWKVPNFGDCSLQF